MVAYRGIYTPRSTLLSNTPCACEFNTGWYPMATTTSSSGSWRLTNGVLQAHWHPPHKQVGTQGWMAPHPPRRYLIQHTCLLCLFCVQHTFILCWMSLFAMDCDPAHPYLRLVVFKCIYSVCLCRHVCHRQDAHRHQCCLPGKRDCPGRYVC